MGFRSIRKGGGGLLLSWEPPLTPTFRGNDIKTVKIVVEGGVVQKVDCPKGVQVIVHDYDVDGVPEDELTQDDQGDECIETIWE